MATIDEVMAQNRPFRNAALRQNHILAVLAKHTEPVSTHTLYENPDVRQYANGEWNVRDDLRFLRDRGLVRIAHRDETNAYFYEIVNKSIMDVRELPKRRRRKNAKATWRGAPIDMKSIPRKTEGEAEKVEKLPRIPHPKKAKPVKKAKPIRKQKVRPARMPVEVAANHVDYFLASPGYYEKTLKQVLDLSVEDFKLALILADALIKRGAR